MEDTRNPETFGDNEVNLLSQIVREAYSDTLATDTWTRILDMIDDLVPYDAAGCSFANVQTRRLENRVTSKVDAELLRWYDEHYGAIEMVTNIALAREVSIWRPSEIIGKQEMEGSEIHQSLLKGPGLGEPICMTCGSATELSARFWFLREHRKGDFSERDRFVLSVLQPHFCTALRLARTLLQGDIYRQSWQQSTLPQFLLDSSGHITEQNIRAVQLFGEGDGKDYLAQVEAIAQGMIARNAFLEILEFAGQTCRIWMAPVVSPNAPTSYMLVIDSADDVHRALTQSMVDAGCSEREVEVCMMLVRGASNRQIADKLFIAESTVKDHVTSIFEKLGITNRSAVVPRLLGI